MAQKTGALIFDEQTDRYDIRFDIADYYGGLHCGECFDVYVQNGNRRLIADAAIWDWYHRAKTTAKPPARQGG